MILPVPGVLSPENIAEILRIKDTLEFVDGKATAGWHAKFVKQNRQAAASDALAAVQRLIIDAIVAHSVIRSFAVPHRISPPLISSYKGGENYGFHGDEAIMGSGPGALRTDIYVTVFLVNPDSYDARFDTIDEARAAVQPRVCGERLRSAHRLEGCCGSAPRVRGTPSSCQPQR